MRARMRFFGASFTLRHSVTTPLNGATITPAANSAQKPLTWGNAPHGPVGGGAMVGSKATQPRPKVVPRMPVV